MILKEQHWQQLFGHQTQTAESWYSISTTYSPDRWRLTRTQMTPQLEVSVQANAVSEIVDPTAGKTAGLFFSDGIVIHAPDSIELGREVEVSLGQLVSENQFDRVTISYDRTGNFQALRKEVFIRYQTSDIRHQISCSATPNTYPLTPFNNRQQVIASRPIAGLCTSWVVVMPIENIFL